jgi:4-amino-4-deoxy-L-arabinose transferase-like glycosyltransferase
MMISTAFNSALERLEIFFGRLNERTVVALIVLAALALRVVRALLTAVVNTDAAVYLYQAKALYYGMWSAVNACSIKYVTVHPIVTAFFYFFTRDWILSMRAVSILFGTLTLIPIYYLARLFFPFRTSCIVTLLYAVMHVFVSVSVDVGRDPAYWLFSACGLYFFAAGMKREGIWYFPLASIAFTLATWNRIEAVLYLVVTALYLLFKKTDGKGRKLLFYLAPVILGVVAFIAVQYLSSREINWYRFSEIPERLTASLTAYRELRLSLLSMIHDPPGGFRFQFFENVRTLLWLLGLGVIVENAAEAFFYPFFALFLVGLFDLRRRLRAEGLVLYFILLCLCGVVLLYVNVFTNWSMENRYLVLLILPSFIFLGFGVERILSFLQQRWGMKEFSAVFLVALLVPLIAVPKQLRFHEKDKAVFKEIGTLIANEEGSARTIEILSIGITMRWVFLYSNLDVPAISCPDDDYLSQIPLRRIVGNSYADFMKTVNARRVRYVVWEERHWPVWDFDLLKAYDTRDFRIVGEWHHRDTGRLVLFKRL